LGPQVLSTQAIPGAQSASLSQRLVQAPFTQRKGSQSLIPAERQVPSPSQDRAVFRRFPEQEGSAHLVSRAYLAHPPRPSQVPVRPQEDCPSSAHLLWGSAIPFSTAKQVPSLPGRLHFWQAPLQATLQQTLSVQKPEAHSVSVVQRAPFIFFPQLPSWQTWLLAHCPLVLQLE
jgi:hypothetical protein